MDENKLIKVMDYIRRFSEENGYTPSVREIGAYCGIKSTATVHSYIERLQEKGYLNKAENKKRAVTLGKSGSVNIPLLGTVTAGQPVFAYENYEEYYSFPLGEFRGEDLFMLHVQGTSMINGRRRRNRGGAGGRIRHAKTFVPPQRKNYPSPRKRSS